jgi:hypothetical protein
MELTSVRLAQYDRDGFLIFPELFGQAAIAVLRQEVVRLSNLRTEDVFPSTSHEHRPLAARPQA